MNKLYLVYIRGSALKILFNLFRLSLRIPFVSKYALLFYLHFKDIGYSSVSTGPVFKKNCKSRHIFIQYEPRFELIVKELEARGICVSSFPRRYIDKLFQKYLGEYQKENPLGFLEYSLDTYARYKVERAMFYKECLFFCALLKKHFSISTIILPKFNDDYTLELIEAFERTGWTTIVYDREGTVTKGRLNSIAPIVSRQAPFCNYLLTYNENHINFFERVFINQVLKKTKIINMGNPASDELFIEKPITIRLPLICEKSSKKILFFAFGALSYIYDSESIKKYPNIWQDFLVELHDAFENFLKNNPDNVLLYKRGPKRGRDFWPGSEKLLTLPNSYLLPSTMDSNKLILNCDIVVAFQTTALIDAMHTSKVIIYCGWGQKYEKFKDELIDFESYARQGAILHASSPEKLQEFLLKNPSDIQIDMTARKKIREMFTSNPDGNIHKRFADFIENIL